MSVTYFQGTDYERKLKRQRGRIYHRLLSGIYFNRVHRLRFMTVTSSPSSPDMRSSWKELVKRIRRTYNEFEYFVVFTDEGHGVAHVVFLGTYIPFEWLQEQWKEIHNAFHVNIKEVRRVYNSSGLAGYFLNQYIANQNAVRHIQQSRGWVYPGYMNDWSRLKRMARKKGFSRNQILSAWHLWLDCRIDGKNPTDEPGGGIGKSGLSPCIC